MKITFSAPLVLGTLDGTLTSVRVDFNRYSSVAVGDTLWVCESWRTEELDKDEGEHPSGIDGIRYKADNGFVPIFNSSSAAYCWIDQHFAKASRKGASWRSSTSMPRWASRLVLEVTGNNVGRREGFPNTRVLTYKLSSVLTTLPDCERSKR